MTGVHPPRRSVLTGAAAAFLAAAPADAQARRPSIIFIMADDLGYADLGCFGARTIRTPNLDRLAQGGVRLLQAYANSAVCSPSRTAVITGIYQDRLVVGLDEPLAGENPPTLPPDQPTLPRRFKAGGYRTALIGKWHLGGGPKAPNAAGYDYFYGFLPGATDYFRRPTDEQSKKDKLGAPLYENETVIHTPGYLTDLLAAAAVRQIEQTERNTPLFLSLHFNAPHWPWEGPRDEETSKALKTLRHSDGGNLAAYAAMVERMDAGVGEVLAALDRSSRTKDTLVVFTSDNGGERFSDTWPFTGVKGELLEGGIRVPAIFRWPGHAPVGAVVEQVAMGMDWLPTLVAAAGLAQEPGARIDGENLLPQLTAGASPRPRKVYWRFNASQQAAIRDGDWKYLKLGEKEHLFNLAQDVRERADRRESEPEIFKRLRKDWDAWNATMLPYHLDSFSETTSHYPDRY